MTSTSPTTPAIEYRIQPLPWNNRLGHGLLLTIYSEEKPNGKKENSMLEYLKTQGKHIPILSPKNMKEVDEFNTAIFYAHCTTGFEELLREQLKEGGFSKYEN